MVLVGAAGTGASAASSAVGTTCSLIMAASGAFARAAAGKDDGGPRDQAGDAKARQDLFQIVSVHACLLVMGRYTFPLGREFENQGVFVHGEAYWRGGFALGRESA